jgi:hypothetical protein
MAGETDISRPGLKLFWAGPDNRPPVSKTTWFSADRGRPDDCDRPGQHLDMDSRPLTDLLIAGQNADGGWGYYRHKQSRLEPTCWAVLALVHTGRQGSSAGEALRRWPARDGLLLERAGGEPNYAFHALALLALRAAALEHRDGNLALFNRLQRVKGLALEPSETNRQDNSIQAWSWIDDTFSWVEPTAWCLLALKTCAQPWRARMDAVRIRDGERLLSDRSCRGGGWNYGNSNMLGKELAAYVPTTAVALLAMRDRSSEPFVIEGLDFLERHATSERSAMALALASRALDVHGRDTAVVRAALQEQVPMTVTLGNHAAIAAALYGLMNDDRSAF